jgi:hypothetical protein
LDDPNYKLAMELYDKSIELQNQGDPYGSTEYYLKALDMQAKLKSIPESAYQQELWLGLPYDISLIVLAFMKNKEVLNCARVCKRWKRRCFDSGK